MDNMPLQNPTGVMDFYTNIEESTLFDCLKYLPEMNDFYDTTHRLLNFPSTDDNPLSYVCLKYTQDEDPKLGGVYNDLSSGFHKRILLVKNYFVLQKKIRTKTMFGKHVCLSDSALHHAAKYFYLLLIHPGKHRLLQGMNRYSHPDSRKIIDNFECDACQKYKLDSRGFGYLPARDVRTSPWEQVDTDPIGLWKVQTRTGRVST